MCRTVHFQTRNCSQKLFLSSENLNVPPQFLPITLFPIIHPSFSTPNSKLHSHPLISELLPPPLSVICSHYSLFSIPPYVPILYFPLLCFLLPHTHFPITPYFLTLLPPLSFLFLPTYHLLSFLLNFYFLVCFPYYLPTAPLPSIL